MLALWLSACAMAGEDSLCCHARDQQCEIFEHGACQLSAKLCKQCMHRDQEQRDKSTCRSYVAAPRVHIMVR